MPPELLGEMLAARFATRGVTVVTVVLVKAGLEACR